MESVMAVRNAKEVQSSITDIRKCPSWRSITNLMVTNVGRVFTQKDHFNERRNTGTRFCALDTHILNMEIDKTFSLFTY